MYRWPGERRRSCATTTNSCSRMSPNARATCARSASELATKERHLQVIFRRRAGRCAGELDDEQRCRFINVNQQCSQPAARRKRRKAARFSTSCTRRPRVRGVRAQDQPAKRQRALDQFRLDRTNQRCSAHWINVDHADSTQSSTIMVLTSASARAQRDERLWTWHTTTA